MTSPLDQISAAMTNAVRAIERQQAYIIELEMKLATLLKVVEAAKNIEHDIDCPIWDSTSEYFHSCDCDLGKSLQELKGW